jgi:predicted dehydrogenase
MRAMETKIRWGILGTGMIAGKMAEGLSVVPGAALTAVASRSKEKAVEFSRRYNVATAYGSYEELAAAPGIDVIYVATPHPYHCENSVMCMKNGKAVICEKPFAMNEREVLRMIAAARENGVFLMEAFWTRFHPSIPTSACLTGSTLSTGRSTRNWAGGRSSTSAFIPCS